MIDDAAACMLSQADDSRGYVTQLRLIAWCAYVRSEIATVSFYTKTNELIMNKAPSTHSIKRLYYLMRTNP